MTTLEISTARLAGYRYEEFRHQSRARARARAQYQAALRRVGWRSAYTESERVPAWARAAMRDAKRELALAFRLGRDSRRIYASAIYNTGG